MSLRRKLIVLLGTIGCAIAIMMPTSSPSLGRIESAAPQFHEPEAGMETVTEIEAGMAALRLQASFALMQLQTQRSGRQ